MPDMTSQSANTGAEVQPRPRVLLCGDPRTAEFQVARHDVSAIIPPETISQVTCLAELREWLADREHPDLLVIVQTWPDEFHFTDVLALPGFGPFSRVICCYGPWCVSDGRNRQDFPLAVRVPVEDFRPVLLRGWQELTGQVVPQSPLPWTAGRDEVFRSRFGGRISGAARGADSSDGPGDLSYATCSPIRVRTADVALSAWWLDTLKSAGWAVATSDPESDGEIVLWDIDVWSDAVAVEWGDLLRRLPAMRIVALTGFVTPDLDVRLKAAGAIRVWSKLLPVAELMTKLRQLNLECCDSSQLSHF